MVFHRSLFRPFSRPIERIEPAQQLDYRTGKLSRDDWRAMDTGLRAEAVELLRRLDALDGPAERPE